jgi:HSP20 family protein
MKSGLEGLRENINDAFDRFLSKWRKDDRDMTEEYWPVTWTAFSGPLVDVRQDDDTIWVTAELPGLSENDFKVELHGNRLSIRGEKKTKSELREGDVYRSECRYGSFARTIPLHCEVGEKKIDARYKNGVLKLRLPKSESGKARRIAVTSR